MLKVLVPTDGSSKSQHGIRHVISEFEKIPGLEVHVLNVQPPFSKHVSDFTNKSDRADFHREQPRRDERGLTAHHPAHPLTALFVDECLHRGRGVEVDHVR